MLLLRLVVVNPEYLRDSHEAMRRIRVLRRASPSLRISYYTTWSASRLLIFGRNSVNTIGFFAQAEAPAEIAFLMVIGPYAVIAITGIEDVSCPSFNRRVNSTPFSLGI